MAGRLVVIEDVVMGRAHRIATWAVDSLLNLQFRNHPQTNKPDSEWLDLFDSLGLKLLHRQAVWKHLVILQVTYVLQVVNTKSATGNMESKHV